MRLPYRTSGTLNYPVLLSTPATLNGKRCWKPTEKYSVYFIRYYHSFYLLIQSCVPPS